MVSPHSIAAALADACMAPPGTDWNQRETLARESLCRQLHQSDELDAGSVFLGGDFLRPYLSARAGTNALIGTHMHEALSTPQLIAELRADAFGPACRTDVHTPRGVHFTWSLPLSASIVSRLAVPRVLLVALTNASRYQTRRYPLNISRLAQWLRFQHAGRVTLSDLALDFDGDVNELCAAVVALRPDVIGVSLNFGEAEALRTLASSLREAGQHPWICVGNVLAAWAPELVADICSGFNVSISYSYGEADLEEVCRAFVRSPEAGSSELVRNVGHDQHRTVRFPTAIILPDERLLRATLKQGGQVSLETSFGCQYGRCSFCPRDHRGRGWLRPSDSAAVVESMARLVAASGEDARVISIVDEDAFGEEGITADCEEPSIVNLVGIAGSFGLGCEIYTRLEQLFNRQRTAKESIQRLQLLRQMQPSLVRVFVGVESGSDTQLRRYAKGQTSIQIVDALRAGALLGLPLEFGFITFDPLLTENELIDNLEFLARTDIILPPRSGLGVDDIFELVASQDASVKGSPVFTRVAYMATELELFVNSAYFKRLQKTHPGLVGARDDSFARYDYLYDNEGVGNVAAWCRVWTEGTFKAIYRMRLASRTTGTAHSPYRGVVEKYRHATFCLITGLTRKYLPHVATRAATLLQSFAAGLPLFTGDSEPSIDKLQTLWKWVASQAEGAAVVEDAAFSLESLRRRRAA